MVLGYLAVLCIVILCLYKLKKVKKIHLSLVFHRLTGIALIVIILLHIALTVHIWENRSLWLIISGILLTLVILFTEISCLLLRKFNWQHKVHFFSACFVCIFALIHIGCYLADFIQYQENIKNIVIKDVDTEFIEDGTYIGEHDAGYIYAKVKVTVLSHKITDIDILEHRNERGREAENITNSIILEQDISIDAVSGATNSSLVIEKAIEKALVRRQQ
ncbi:MAG: FMN-binding protein [Lachnospiraceae bacterium]|nr:FMN-binding protein [Lachnospiraceae bacterium]